MMGAKLEYVVTGGPPQASPSASSISELWGEIVPCSTCCRPCNGLNIEVLSFIQTEFKLYTEAAFHGHQGPRYAPLTTAPEIPRFGGNALPLVDRSLSYRLR